MHSFPTCLRCIVLCLVLIPTLNLFSQQSTPVIEPYSEDPRYWQFDGKPVMLLGGSVTDHLFLIDDLQEHLDQIHSVGGNYVRNTMSQRESKDLKPHLLLADGKFDLDHWNEDYWRRFENMLTWTAQRNIFVQIEVWDRFDFSREHWDESPWNPANNINYRSQQVGLATSYPDHPSRDRQPFFHTIEGLPLYDAKLDRIRKYQESFVRKLLSYSLQYGHVLYCMDNETSTPAGWGQYWIELIQNSAKAKAMLVPTTDMFDDAFRGDQAIHTPLVFRDPQHYTFADISQVNSRNYDDTHWERLQWLLARVNQIPRPSNHTKIYGSGYMGFGTGGPEDGVERFWRNILAGSAAARFHRAEAGNGLNDAARASIQAARLLEQRMKFWEIEPHQELLSDRQPNEAYLAANPGRAYALYFTNGGSVTVDLTQAAGDFGVTWISVSMGIVVGTTSEPGKRRPTQAISGGKPVTLSAPYKGGWVAAIVRKAAGPAAEQTGGQQHGCAERLGTIEPGKLADLVLVKGWPDQDIRTMYDVQRVMLNGVWIDQ